MKGITALMVHDEEQPFYDLQHRVSEFGVPSIRLRTVVEVKYFLKRLRQPALIFTDVDLPDGTWADVVTEARNATPPAPVIVVSHFVDLSLYLEALEKGATDFIVAPFTAKDLERVFRTAAETSAGDREQASKVAVDEAVGTNGTIFAKRQFEASIKTEPGCSKTGSEHPC